MSSRPNFPRRLLRVETVLNQGVSAVEPDDYLVAWSAGLFWPDWAQFDDDDDDDMESTATKPLVVAEATGFIINLDRVTDVREALDAHSGDTAEYMRLFEENDVSKELADRLHGAGERIIIWDRITVRPDWRRQGLGPLLGAMALRELRPGSWFAACYPAPFELERDDPKWSEGLARLERMWGQLGFEHYQGGVWFLDYTLRRLDDACDVAQARVLGEDR